MDGLAAGAAAVAVDVEAAVVIVAVADPGRAAAEVEMILGKGDPADLGGAEIAVLGGLSRLLASSCNLVLITQIGFVPVAVMIPNFSV